MPDRILILGLGNVLMGDEGIGVKVVEYLQEQHMPAHVDLLDGGTGGFQLLSLFQEYPQIIIVDATIGRNTPGKINVLTPRFASEFPRSLTSHDIGLKDLMQSAELLGDLPAIHLLTVNIQKCPSAGTGISRDLCALLPEIHRRIQGIVEQLR